jgi:hypothetical protein
MAQLARVSLPETRALLRQNADTRGQGIILGPRAWCLLLTARQRTAFLSVDLSLACGPFVSSDIVKCLSSA